MSAVPVEPAEAGAIVVRDLGRRSLEPVWAQMKAFTDARGADTADEIWLVEHPPVFTLGLNGNRAHLLAPGDIPVVKIDRGGQVTYHGPGQVVAYVMVDLKRRGLNVRALVVALENAVIDTLREYGVAGYGRRDAPGVYVAGRKLAAIGLRVRRHASYHGIAINIAMDLEPFTRINPCGFEGLEVTQLADLVTAGVDRRQPGPAADVGVGPFRGRLVPHLLARIAGGAPAG